MPRYQVKYSTFSIPSPRPLAQTLTQTPPAPVQTSRPVVPVTLDYQGKQWSVYAIVDSGADQCLFPSYIIPVLGLNIQNARVSMFSGAGSVNQVSLFFDGIGITVGIIPRFVGTVAFSAAMNQAALGLLGQSGFFSRFKVDFDLPNGFFYVEDPVQPSPPPANPPQQLPNS